MLYTESLLNTFDSEAHIFQQWVHFSTTPSYNTRAALGLSKTYKEHLAQWEHLGITEMRTVSPLTSAFKIILGNKALIENLFLDDWQLLFSQITEKKIFYWKKKNYKPEYWKE